MSCVARSYPRAEFEYQALYDYDFDRDRKSERKSKISKIEDAWNYAKSWYEYHISKFKEVPFEDFAFIHSVLYKEVIPNKEGKLPSGYKNMYAFANMLGGDLDKYVSHRAKAFLNWLNSDAGRWFIHNIREEANVKRRIALANALASYYIKTFYPYSIEGAMNKYLEFEYKYVGKHVYRLWSNPLFWASFGVGMATWEEIQRLRKVNDYMRFIVSDPIASEVFIQEMRSWWDATSNLTDWDRQLNRSINALRDFIVSGSIISTIAGDVGSAVIAETLRRGVVVGLEALAFLLMNFTAAGKIARGVKALAQFVNRSVLSFLGFQVFVEWPIDGKIQIWLNGYLERIFDSNFNPNKLVLDPKEIEELRKNTNIPNAWGGLTKYEWAELWKLLKALYFGEFYLTEAGRRRLTELLDKADIRYVNAMRLKLRSMKIELEWRRRLSKALRARVHPFPISCRYRDFYTVDRFKEKIVELVNVINSNSNYARIELPQNFRRHDVNFDFHEVDIQGITSYGQYHQRSKDGCFYLFSFLVARYQGEHGFSYHVRVMSSYLKNEIFNVNATNGFIHDLLLKMLKDDVYAIRRVGLIKRNDMYYLQVLASGFRKYALVDGNLRGTYEKRRYLIPLSEAVGFGYLQSSNWEGESYEIMQSSSQGIRPDPARHDPRQYTYAIIDRAKNESINLRYEAGTGVKTTILRAHGRGGGKWIYYNSELVVSGNGKYAIKLSMSIESYPEQPSASSSFSMIRWQADADTEVHYYPGAFIYGSFEHISNYRSTKTVRVEDKKEFIIDLSSLSEEEVREYFEPPSLHNDYEHDYKLLEMHEATGKTEYEIPCFEELM
ncbi:MAG: hypothetical protein QW706_09715 [Candidatus Nezhaarchaeales archaeon]